MSASRHPSSASPCNWPSWRTSSTSTPKSPRSAAREPLPFFAMLNPCYEPLGTGTAAFYEGCLSVNGLQAAVLRPESVRLDFTAVDGHCAAA